MAKTKILDAILAAPRGRCKHVDDARELLVMPEKNHAFSDGDPFRASVDRYVVPDVFFKVVNETAIDIAFPDQEKSESDFTTVKARAPLPIFYVEMNGVGYLFDAHLGILEMYGCNHQGVKLFAAVPLSLENSVFQFTDGAVMMLSYQIPNPSEFNQHIARSVFRFIAFCTLVTTPRAVSVRRQSPGRMTRAERMAIQRAAQRGRPMHSFNVVTFRPGGPSIQRGCVAAAESISGGVRRHWASGHWRLICPKDGRAAYVIWIDATEKGNIAIGRVVKTKVVKVAAGEVRRGYVLPARAGKRGERIEVQAAH